MNKKIIQPKDNYIFKSTESIRSCIKKMDNQNIELVVLVDEKEYVCGVVSEGDIRRAILYGLDLKASVETIVNKNFKFLEVGFQKNDAVALFKDRSIAFLPVLKKKKLINIVSRDDFIAKRDNEKLAFDVSKLPVVIMAGGKGTRLDPFTRILPKPLIPVGNDPIIKIIIDEFSKYGLHNFYVSLNDKGRMIKAYFHDHEYEFKLHFIEEKMALGTAGALKMLEHKIKTPFFVSNCDVIIHTDYVSIFDFHQKGQYDLTLVGSMQQYAIPYGICDIKKGGALKDIREKPEYDFLVNTGFYLLNPSVLKFIPDQKYYDMPDLIKLLKKKKRKVGVYPVSKNAWIDVGQWTDYKKMVDKLNLN